jgi:hypothetical protein
MNGLHLEAHFEMFFILLQNGLYEEQLLLLGHFEGEVFK